MRRKREEDKTRLGKESEKRMGEGCGRVQEEGRNPRSRRWRKERCKLRTNTLPGYHQVSYRYVRDW